MISKTVSVFALIATVFLAFYIFWPIGADYHYTYESVTRAWLTGKTQLYDAQSVGYFNAPWLVLILAPVVQLPDRAGEAVINTCTLLIAVFAARAFTKRSAAAILAVATLHTFDVLIRGQIDGLVLGGVALAWLGLEREKPWWVGAALPVLLVKPTGVFLIMLLCLRWAWTRRAWQVAVPTLGALALSVAIAGPDWVARYVVQSLREPPMVYLQTTIWRVLDAPQSILVGALAIGALVTWWHLGHTRKAFLLALAGGLFFSPYALGSHYILLIPVMAAFADKNLALGALVYLTTLTPLLRIWHGFAISPIDAGYPLALLILVWVVLERHSAYNNCVMKRTYGAL
jgi:hypothetical protein